ncbi:MAG: CvpA family protein, partial [Planctomycetes bacterium]|nr:CvpA family protein [Planctomycetota bacterium]
MLFSILLVGFLGAATYMQAIQGVTSAAITCVMVVVSTAISFGTYEYVAESFLMGSAPEYAYALALAGTFAVPLIVLRVLMDVVVPRSNLLPQVIDRGVAGVFGFFGAMLTTGIIACSIQMLPWGVVVADTGDNIGEVSGGFFGFRRFNPKKPDEQNELWLKPDRFTIGFAEMLSVNTFGGSDEERTLARHQPDLLRDLSWAHSLPVGARSVVKPEDVKVVDVGKLNYFFSTTTRLALGRNKATPVDPKAGKMFVYAALELSGEMNDVDDKKRFSATCIRIVGESKGERLVIPGTALIDPDDPSHYVVEWKPGNADMEIVAGKVFLIPLNNKIEVAFEVPEDFKPQEIRFKIGGRAKLSSSQIARITGDATGGSARAANPRPAKADPARSASSSSGSQPQKSGGGRVSGVAFRSSRFGGDLPMKLTSFRQVDAEIQSGVLEQGLLTGKVADQTGAAKNGPVSKLKVPKGKALLQLNVKSLHAGSLLGKALNFAVKTVENYTIEDDQGNRILACGKYAVAKVGDEQIFELSYYPTFESGGGRYKPFSRIKSQHLKKDYQLVYLFLIDSGRQAVKFSTGAKKRTIDLRKENLV